jgi:hypothetical protein
MPLCGTLVALLIERVELAKAPHISIPEAMVYVQPRKRRKKN